MGWLQKYMMPILSSFVCSFVSLVILGKNIIVSFFQQQFIFLKQIFHLLAHPFEISHLSFEILHICFQKYVMSRFCSFASSLISFIFLIWQQAYSRSHEDTLRFEVNITSSVASVHYPSSSKRTSRLIKNCKIILILIHKIGIIIMILKINFAILIFFFTLRLVSTGILDKTILIASSPRCTVFWLQRLMRRTILVAILHFFKMRAQP